MSDIPQSKSPIVIKSDKDYEDALAYLNHPDTSDQMTEELNFAMEAWENLKKSEAQLVATGRKPAVDDDAKSAEEAKRLDAIEAGGAVSTPGQQAPSGREALEGAFSGPKARGFMEGANLGLTAKASGAGAAAADLFLNTPRATRQGIDAPVASAGDSAATARKAAIGAEDEATERAIAESPVEYYGSLMLGGALPTIAMSEIALANKARGFTDAARRGSKIKTVGKVARPSVDELRQIRAEKAIELTKAPLKTRLQEAGKQGAKYGGATGAVAGYGASRSDDAAGTLVDTATGGAVGAGLGYPLGVAADYVVGGGLRRAGKASKRTLTHPGAKMRDEIANLEGSGGGLSPVGPLPGAQLTAIQKEAAANPERLTPVQQAVSNAAHDAAEGAEGYRSQKVGDIVAAQRGYYGSDEAAAVDPLGVSRDAAAAIDDVIGKHQEYLFHGNTEAAEAAKEKLLIRIMREVEDRPARQEVPPMLGPPGEIVRALPERGPMGLLGFRTPPRTKQGVAPPPAQPVAVDEFSRVQQPPPALTALEPRPSPQQTRSPQQTQIPQEPLPPIRVDDATELPRAAQDTVEGLAEAGIAAPRAPKAAVIRKPREAVRRGPADEAAMEADRAFARAAMAPKAPQKRLEEIVLNRPMNAEQLDKAIKFLRSESGYDSGTQPSPQQQVMRDVVDALYKVRRDRFPNYPGEPKAIKTELDATMGALGITDYGRLETEPLGDVFRAVENRAAGYRGSDTTSSDAALRRVMATPPRRQALEAVPGMKAYEVLRGRGSDPRAGIGPGGAYGYVPNVLERAELRAAGLEHTGQGPARAAAVQAPPLTIDEMRRRNAKRKEARP